MKLEISEEVLRSLKLPPEEVEGELRKELALALYGRGVLSAGKARELAGMTRRQFDELLEARGAVRHYSESDLQDDIVYARDAGNRR
jgi:predicted HTH domain antitoxin